MKLDLPPLGWILQHYCVCRNWAATTVELQQEMICDTGQKVLSKATVSSVPEVSALHLIHFPEMFWRERNEVWERHFWQGRNCLGQDFLYRCICWDTMRRMHLQRFRSSYCACTYECGLRTTKDIVLWKSSKDWQTGSLLSGGVLLASRQILDDCILFYIVANVWILYIPKLYWLSKE